MSVPGLKVEQMLASSVEIAEISAYFAKRDWRCECKYQALVDGFEVLVELSKYSQHNEFSGSGL
jgi:hypothetical protein